MSVLQHFRTWFGGAKPRSVLGNSQPWAPTHRHAKGGLYRKLGYATLEADRSRAVVYDDADGEVWVRVATEFEDGRFTPLD